MRIVAISDTHGQHANLQVPDGDVLVHAGDFTSQSSDVSTFNDWLATLPHPHKMVIAGNHDFFCEHHPEQMPALLNAGTYLCDSAITIAGILFYGSPWQPEFFNWAFNLKRGKALQKVWQKIPPKTDVLITHAPPYGVLDRNNQDERVGCEDLLARVHVVSPRLHVFGHIHEGYGATRSGPTHFVNAAICDVNYVPRNLPVVIDI